MVAEMERKFSRERQQVGIEAAKAKGVIRDVMQGLRRSKGSVRARASQYRLSWNEANRGSCCLQDGQHHHGPPEVDQSLAIGGHMLMVAGARAEDVAGFIVSTTEPCG
jgi:hypothetical protein